MQAARSQAWARSGAWGRAWLALGLILGALLLVPADAAAASGGGRYIPVGLSNTENQVMNSNRYVYAIRFVLDRPTRMYRFISGFRLDGALGFDVGHGYGRGSGGRIRARLVGVRRDGRPNMRRVIASETVGVAPRLVGTTLAYGVNARSLLLYFNTRGVRLRANHMYAMTYQNRARNPRANFFSEESPTIRAALAGPNGRNTRSRRARGAVAGLDPREAVGWSRDGGKRWTWGRRVGVGRTPGAYGGSTWNDNGVRLPWYGWQASASSPPQSNQPYYAYKERGSFTLIARNPPHGALLREAGGYAPVGSSVGVVTVKNLRTGGMGQTAPLGGGLARGALQPPVGLAPGDTYSISNTGTVYKAEGDIFLTRIFGLGNPFGSHRFETVGYGSDRAELFALPHPFYGLP